MENGKRAYVVVSDGIYRSPVDPDVERGLIALERSKNPEPGPALEEVKTKYRLARLRLRPTRRVDRRARSRGSEADCFVSFPQSAG